MDKPNGVIIRSNNVGGKYRVPQPFSKTNRSFNSIGNYAFARKSSVNRSLKSSGFSTSKFVLSNTRNIRTNKSISVFNDKNNRSIFVNSVNRKTGTIVNQKFYDTIKNNIGNNSPNSTYQNRLNKSYMELQGNSIRRNLK